MKKIAEPYVAVLFIGLKNNIMPNKLTKEEEQRSDELMKLIEKKERELEALKKEMRLIVYKIESGR